MTGLTWMPRGSPVSEQSWQARHRVVQAALWLSVLALLILGVLGPRPLLEGLALPLVVAGLGLAALAVSKPVVKAECISLGVISASFVGIELSGGQVHAHLFILSAIALVSLYQRWGPLLYTSGAVLVHHIGLGILSPERVFSLSHSSAHPMSTDFSGWQIVGMVLVHFTAVALEVVAILLFWRFSETLSRQLHTSLTDLKAREEELHHQATHDLLTGLPNRAMFAELVSLTLMKHESLAILMLDVDDFKGVNDTYGHHAGDEVLKSVAERLSKAMRRNDMVSRLSGDEFAALLTPVDDVAEAQRVADRIHQQMSAPFDFEGQLLQVNVSIGIAHTDDPLALEDLLRHADSAMYQAKGEGKGRSASYRRAGASPSDPSPSSTGPSAGEPSPSDPSAGDRSLSPSA